MIANIQGASTLLRSFRLLPIVCLAIGFLSDPCPAAPKELISIWESVEQGDPAQPWPEGLRIVLYDTGQLLKLTRRYSETSEGQVTSGAYAPAEAKQLATEMLSKLRDVSPVLDAGVRTNSRRTTILQIWDEAKQSYVKWHALGHLCRSLSDADLTALDQQMRGLLDRRFIDACDYVLALAPPDTKDWVPERLRIQLQATSIVKEAEAWPEAWVEEARYQRRLYACVVNQGIHQGIAGNLISHDPVVRRATLGSVILSSDGKLWRLKSIKYALPGPIYYTFGGGDNIGTMVVSSGPCPRPLPR